MNMIQRHLHRVVCSKAFSSLHFPHLIMYASSSKRQATISNVVDLPNPFLPAQNRPVASPLTYTYKEELYDLDTDLDDDGTDIESLRYTLLQCRSQLLALIEAMIDTELAYGKVVLRIEFEELQNQCEQLHEETDQLKNNFQDLNNSCKFLIQQTTELIVERDQYYFDWQHASNILTPRPDWDKCCHVVAGGMPRWQSLSIAKTSEQLVDVLIDEIMHGNTQVNHDKYLPLIECNKNIEQTNTFFNHLCMSKKNLIKNRQMRRRITGLLIKEIWSSKLFDEKKSESKYKIDLSDYVFNYLTKRFTNHDLAIEIGYNIKDACNRYRSSYEINLFWQILTGQVEEYVYYHEMREFARVLQYLITLRDRISVTDHFSPSTNETSKIRMHDSFSWIIRWSDFGDALRELFPNWTSERISLLIASAERDLHASSMNVTGVEFPWLFMEDDEGRIGEFLTTIREQLRLDKDEYIEKIKNLLIGHPLVSMVQFKRAVQLVDPHISSSELRRYVNWVFESKQMSRIIKDHQTIRSIKVTTRDFEEIILRLECCCCFMHKI